MAQVIGSLPFMWETWIEYLITGFSPCPSPAMAGIWAVSQQTAVLAIWLCVTCSISQMNKLFKIQKKTPTKWILNLGMNRIKRKEKEVIQPCGRGRAATGQGPPVATGSGGGVFLLTPIHGEKPCWQLDLWPQELWEMDFSCFAPLDLWKICYSNHKLLTFF